ncbi:MAG: pyridoxamine 5'-phosphate oxidase family protein [Candidatus Competibacteraceae bacterium]|jgi:hypothetical protein|nr:pyridoxamine 5'-phosphate oxidase family protein [Candidatus Competibacteraceae bacterium]
MGQRYPELSEKLSAFIQQQKLFFVGTAAQDGRVNISPKGMDTLRVLGSTRVVWLNLTGSGNETAAHLLENDRMTLMFCAFEGNPLILRLYGHAQIIHPRNKKWSELFSLFPALAGARQIIDMSIDLVQTSCGMAVPYFDFQGERTQLKQWAEKKGQQGIQSYWEEKNQQSLDGKPTEILSS